MKLFVLIVRFVVTSSRGLRSLAVRARSLSHRTTYSQFLWKTLLKRGPAHRYLRPIPKHLAVCTNVVRTLPSRTGDYTFKHPRYSRTLILVTS